MVPGFVPSDQYRALIDAGELLPDAAQTRLLPVIDELCEEFVPRHEAPRLRGLVDKVLRKPEMPVKGLYLWGAVGRGKTLLMDLIYQSLGDVPRQRLHFHRLMQRVHESLGRYAGHQDPLQLTAANLRAEARVVCIDEFYVTDIGDAMILAELLQALIARGVTLVATSNLAPENLYENGLQRRRFLPVIDLIREHMRVVAIGAGEDFRMRLLRDAGVYHTSNDEAAEAKMLASFLRLADEPVNENTPLEILGREIRARRVAGGVALFDFRELCETARSQLDYIEISRLFHTLLLSNVPVMDGHQENAARRFIALIDELYDRCVNLIISAEAEVEALYRGEQHGLAFERCASRLIEMRSIEYMERMHKA
ncbi:MAG: cell division protein ZapE [Gammaproteobacteria bacterium]|nr:cell division protein ZapE [Gammaproteobacteria bacterium]